MAYRTLNFNLKMRLSERTSAFLSPQSLLSGDPCLFVNRLHTAPFAELLELYLPLHQFLVFIGVIITTLADTATHRDQPVDMLYLGHGNDDTIFLLKKQRRRPGISRSDGIF
jgi:hypothetical protein